LDGSWPCAAEKLRPHSEMKRPFSSLLFKPLNYCDLESTIDHHSVGFNITDKTKTWFKALKIFSKLLKD